MLIAQDTLTYACACSSGPTPNVTDYGQTLPSLMCLQWKLQCLSQSPTGSQDNCRAATCGMKNASALGNTTPISNHFTVTVIGSASQATAAATSTTGQANNAAGLATAAIGGIVTGVFFITLVSSIAGAIAFFIVCMRRRRDARKGGPQVATSESGGGLQMSSANVLGPAGTAQPAVAQ